MDNQKEREILRESPTNFAEIVTIKTMSSSSPLQQSFKLVWKLMITFSLDPGPTKVHTLHTNCH